MRLLNRTTRSVSVTDAGVLNLAFGLTHNASLGNRTARERDDQLAASATAMPTATADNPPTTKASHITSLASSRIDFHIDVLSPSPRLESVASTCEPSC
jgi:hypothetical protein